MPEQDKPTPENGSSMGEPPQAASPLFIKQLSTRQIEEAFAKALEELTGQAYWVSISKLQYLKGSPLFPSDPVAIRLKLDQKKDLSHLKGFSDLDRPF